MATAVASPRTERAVGSSGPSRSNPHRAATTTPTAKNVVENLASVALDQRGVASTHPFFVRWRSVWRNGWAGGRRGGGGRPDGCGAGGPGAPRRVSGRRGPRVGRARRRDAAPLMDYETCIGDGPPTIVACRARRGRARRAVPLVEGRVARGRGRRKSSLR